jgi:hypothetical protein
MSALDPVSGHDGNGAVDPPAWATWTRRQGAGEWIAEEYGTASTGRVLSRVCRGLARGYVRVLATTLPDPLLARHKRKRPGGTRGWPDHHQDRHRPQHRE